MRDQGSRGICSLKAAVNSRHSSLENLHRFASRRIAAKGRGVPIFKRSWSNSPQRDPCCKFSAALRLQIHRVKIFVANSPANAFSGCFDSRSTALSLNQIVISQSPPAFFPAELGCHLKNSGADLSSGKSPS